MSSRARSTRAIASLGILLPALLVLAESSQAASAFSKPGARTPFASSASRARASSPTKVEGVVGVTGAWQSMPPPSLTETSSAYDPVRQRLLIFGGDDGVNVSNDLWALSLTGSPVWTKLTVTGTRPSKRSAHGILYDPLRDRLLLFGGRDSAQNTLNDVWELPLGVLPLTWSQGSPSGTPPSPRAYFSAVYDSANDRVVVFGGATAVTDTGPPTGFLNDIWALPLGGPLAWQQIIPVAPAGGVPTTPVPRAAATAVYDGPRGRMIINGGFDGSAIGETWELSLGVGPTWTMLLPTGGPPDARAAGAAILDPPNDRMIVYGGIGGPDVDQDLTDVWELALASPAWTQLSPGGPAPTPRDFPNGVYDLAGRRLVVFSGRDSMGGTVSDAVIAMNLDGAPTWTALGAAPPSRAHGTAVYDPIGDRLVLFGGFDGNQELGDTWTFSLATQSWTQLSFGGSTPGARTGQSVIFDAARDRVVLYGGNQGVAAYGDVWELTLGGTPAWAPIGPSGGPPADRTNHSAVYDWRHDRMIVYGGQVPAGAAFGDAWAFDLATNTWSLLDDGTSGPPARAQHAAVYDDANDRMLVYSGFGLTDDLWALSLSGTPAWSQIFPLGGPTPSGRYGSAAAYDSAADAMLLFGGAYTGGGDNNDAWVLTLRGTPSWQFIDQGDPIPRDREEPASGYDQAGARLLMFGGNRNGNQYLSDTWAFTLDRTTPVLGAMIRASARADRIELSWWLPAMMMGVRIERRESATAWSLVATRATNGSGRLDWVDANVVAGHRYGYRLVAADGSVLANETWVEVPAIAAMELSGFVPNPARNVASLAFTLPSAAPARIEVLDLAGRRVFAREVGNLGPGRHVVPVGGAGLQAGVYLIRLVPRSGGEVLRRAVLLR